MEDEKVVLSTIFLLDFSVENEKDKETNGITRPKYLMDRISGVVIVISPSLLTDEMLFIKLTSFVCDSCKLISLS